MRSKDRLFYAAVIGLALLGGQNAFADTVQINEGTQHRYEWRASTFSLSAQAEGGIGVDSSGQITCVWSSRRQQGGRYGVYAQRFDPSGVAIGSEMVLNLWTDSHQTAPAIAFDNVGGGWAVWQSHGQDGQAGSIIARRLDEKLQGGSEILVNQQWRGHQIKPVVAAAADGTAMVVWTSAASGDQPSSIRGRLLKADGSPLGDEFAISTVQGRIESIPCVAADTNGGFVVVFAVADEQSAPIGIRLQRFDATGTHDGEEVNLHQGLMAGVIEPVVAATRDGFLVAWLDRDVDGSDFGIVAQRCDFRGCPEGQPFVVNTNTQGPQVGAAIAVASDGTHAVAWNGPDGDGVGVFVQLFAADGSRFGGEVRLNQHTGARQAMTAATGVQRLAFTSDGALACVWDGNAGLGDDSSINVTMLRPTPLQLADQKQGVTADMPSAGEQVLLAQGPGPHEPPTFNPRDVEKGAREIREGAEIGFTGVFNTGWTPPDPHMAVGPDHVVVMTNGAIAFFTKDGNLTFQDEIENSFGFWGSVGATGFVFDPEVIYDELSGRFFAMAAEAFAGNQSYALVAVSDDSDPNGSWHKYRFNTSPLAGDLFDSPNIGVDADTLYITGDGFGLGANYPVFVYDKASLLVGNPPAQTNFFTLPTSTQSAGIPPVSFDNPPALYMIEHRESVTNTTVRLIALQDALTSPAITNFTLTVPSYGRPEDPPQMGTGNRPETFDARFWSAAYRNGSLWATHHINSNRVLARWYEIAMNGWPDSGQNPTLVQSGEIDPGAGIRTFFSSITVDDHGNAAMTFSRSSSSEFISMATAFRVKSDPLGTFRDDVIQQTSNAPYTPGRWGDYSAVNVDPANGITFWAHHEYAINNSWRTWVQAFTPDLTATPYDVDVFRGVHDSGNLNSLLASDDNKLCYTPGITLDQTEAPITLDFFGTLPNDSPSTLEVTIESSANTVGLELTISFWNFNTNSWDVVGTDAQSLNTDTVRTFSGNPADHVEPGTGEVRTRYEVRQVSIIFIFPWKDCVDQIFWSIT